MSKCGLATDVYSRVVGYHQPVKKWNKGKVEEFKDRLEFEVGIPKGLHNFKPLLKLTKRQERLLKAFRAKSAI